MHICVGNLTIIGSDNRLSPGWGQVIIYLNQCWNIVNWTLRNKFNEISIGIQTFLFKKMHYKMSSAKWRPFCLGLNMLNPINQLPVLKKNEFEIYTVEITATSS